MNRSGRRASLARAQEALRRRRKDSGDESAPPASGYPIRGGGVANERSAPQAVWRVSILTVELGTGIRSASPAYGNGAAQDTEQSSDTDPILPDGAGDRSASAPN